jgi:hypothetical protein
LNGSFPHAKFSPDHAIKSVMAVTRHQVKHARYTRFLTQAHWD